MQHRRPETETTSNEPATADASGEAEPSRSAAAVWRPAQALLHALLDVVGAQAAEGHRLAGLADGAWIDPERGEQVAAAFLAVPSTPVLPEVQQAYWQLRVETDALYARLVAPREDGGLGLVVRHQLTDPYQQAEEIVDDLASGILRMGPNRPVHDVLGHAALGAGFDRHGEYACWLVQRRLHAPAAAAALTTELHGENCVLWVTGRHAVHKAALLPPSLRIPRPP